MAVEDLLYSKKTPSSKKKHVGIEIECLLSNKMSKKLDKLLIEKNLQWNVHVGTDGSIRPLDFVPEYREVQRPWGTQTIIVNENERFIGREIRILAEERDAPSIIDEVCSILKECKASVNDSCGLHVHLDMRSRDHETVYNNFYRYQDLLYKMQPKSRRTNKFCRKLNRLLTDSNNRYYGINKQAYKDHRTLEIRLHEGTVNAADIRRWVFFLIKIANLNTKLKRKPKELNGLELSDTMKEYINVRLTKFAK